MYYSNEMKIKFERKEDAIKALTIVEKNFSEGDFYQDYKEGLMERVLKNITVNENEIVLGDGIDGYFDPEDSRKVFETIITNLASELTLINFEAEALNHGDYSSSRITAQFKNGGFNLQNEYWNNFDEDGESDLHTSYHYFF